MLTEVKLLHVEKALNPIEVTVYSLVPSDTFDGIIKLPETSLPALFITPVFVRQVFAVSSITV